MEGLLNHEAGLKGDTYDTILSERSNSVDKTSRGISKSVERTNMKLVN